MAENDDLPRLSQSTLGWLNPLASPPGYDRESVAPGIVHLGLGAFARAHLATYLERVQVVFVE